MTNSNPDGQLVEEALGRIRTEDLGTPGNAPTPSPSPRKPLRRPDHPAVCGCMMPYTPDSDPVSAGPLFDHLPSDEPPASPPGQAKI